MDVIVAVAFISHGCKEVGQGRKGACGQGNSRVMELNAIFFTMDIMSARSGILLEP